MERACGTATSPNYMKNMSQSRPGKMNGMYGTHRIGAFNPFHGRKHTETTRLKISETKKNNNMKGDKAPNWLGDNASYDTVHAWVRKNKGTANICEKCGITRMETSMHWANKDHKYSRDLGDYISLCAKCHWDYDKKNNNKKHGVRGRDGCS